MLVNIRRTVFLSLRPTMSPAVLTARTVYGLVDLAFETKNRYIMIEIIAAS